MKRFLVIGLDGAEPWRKTGTDSLRVFEEGCLSPLSEAMP